MSKLGTRFFAHSNRGPCDTAPETAEHLLIKESIARIARSAGWIAEPEYRGLTPDGRAWVADVLCRHPGRDQPIVFEVQWSPQTPAETYTRNELYRASNVRAIWLLRESRIARSRDLAAFSLAFDKTTPEPLVLVQRPHQLSEFVWGVLFGRLRFAPNLGSALPLRVHASPIKCWKCRGDTLYFQWADFSTKHLFKQFPFLGISLTDLDRAGEAAIDWLDRVLPMETLKAAGIGPLRRRFSRGTGTTNLSNGCVHCDTLQPNYLAKEYAPDTKHVLTLEAAVEPWMTDRIQGFGAVVRDWWFDDL